MGSLVLFEDSVGNRWDITGSGEWTLVDAAHVDDEETVLFTQETAWAALSASDYEAGCEWAVEQTRELPPLFERLPIRLAA